MGTTVIAIAGATVVPLILGFVWYHPKVFGNAWMKASGLSVENMKGSNMLLIFGMTTLFSLFIATFMQFVVIHQIHFSSILTNQLDSSDPNSESSLLLKKLMNLYGTSYRTFKHGAFHGTAAGILLALPILGINALFERKGSKYIALNAGYWILCLGLMGGIICAFS
ncbi:MAG: DUF1761 domain-containing protein [bacterium]|nr:DUF1761 domain-containing protein [bacterium]